MKVKIGTGEFTVMPVEQRAFGSDAAVLIERSRADLIQYLRCNRPSDPNPLKDKLSAQTNLLFFSPSSEETPIQDLGRKFTGRQKSEMASMTRKFMRRSGVSHPSKINETLQAALGTYELKIDWSKIKPQLDPGYSYVVLSIARYRHFWLRQLDFGKAHTIVSIPFKIDTYAQKYEKCTEQGVELLDTWGSGDKVDYSFVKPVTEEAKKLRETAEKVRRKKLKKKMDELKKELGELNEEKAALTPEGE